MTLHSDTEAALIVVAAMMLLAVVWATCHWIKKNNWNLGDAIGRMMVRRARRAQAQADAYDIGLSSFRIAWREYRRFMDATAAIELRCTGERKMETETMEDAI